MHHPRSRWSALTLIVVLTTLLASCAPPAVAPPDEQTGPQGTLRIGLTTNVAALEWPYAPERQSANASSTIFDTLLFPEPDGTFSPSLAERWELSPDGREVTFYLRQGVTFHNGEAFNADSVIFSWEVYKQPEVTYANYWTLVTEVQKIDDYTVKLVTEEPNFILLPYVAWGWSMIPPNYYREVGPAGFAENPVGAGPFVFKEWVKGSHLIVEANPNYWRAGYPKVARIEFRFMPESSTRVAAIQADEIDIAPRLSAEEASTIANTSGVNVLEYFSDRVYYVAFNNMTTGVGTPIENPEVRKALSHAVDIDAIIDALFSGNATRATGFVSPVNLGYVASDPVPYDPDVARQMLADAGYASGFTLDMACPDGAYPNINEVCQAIRGYFDAVGVVGDLDIMESNAYWELEANKQLPPAFVDSWSVTLPEAYPRLQGALGKDQTYANWSSDRVHGLLQRIATAVDVDQRAGVYGEIQQVMRDDPPFIYLYFPSVFEGVRSRVQNYQPRAAENYFLWNVSVAP
jgi:peptide/nickel transport system substrate-binding protein